MSNSTWHSGLSLPLHDSSLCFADELCTVICMPPQWEWNVTELNKLPHSFPLLVVSFCIYVTEVELTAPETLQADMWVVISGLSGFFHEFLYLPAEPCHIPSHRKGGCQWRWFAIAKHITVLQRFCNFLTRERGVTLLTAVWDGLGVCSEDSFGELSISYTSVNVVGTLCTSWLTLQQIFHSLFLFLHCDLRMMVMGNISAPLWVRKRKKHCCWGSF